MTGLHQPLPAAPVLALGQVHVVWLRLDLAKSELGRCREILETVELERARRFLRPLHRARFVAARGQLRILLAPYLDSSPRDVRFTCGVDGKPALPTCVGRSGPPIHFNLAHSEDRAIVAVSRHVVGVDLERVTRFREIDEVPRQHFSASEQRAMQALEPGRRLEAFYAVWTRKEAFLKGVGGGLMLPLDSFDVDVDPDAPARIVAVRLAGPGGVWALRDLAAGVGWRACLAVGIDTFSLDEFNLSRVL